MSSKSKTQLSLQDKKKIIQIIEAREKVGGKPKFYANCQRFQHTQNNNWKNSQRQGHFQVKTDFRNTKSNCEKVITRTDLNKALDTVLSFLQTNCLETSRLDLENISRDVNSFYASSQSQASIKCFFSAL